MNLFIAGTFCSMSLVRFSDKPLEWQKSVSISLCCQKTTVQVTAL